MILNYSYEYLHHTHSVLAPYMLHTYSVHAPYPLHTCSVHALYPLRTEPPEPLFPYPSFISTNIQDNRVFRKLTWPS